MSVCLPTVSAMRRSGSCSRCGTSGWPCCCGGAPRRRSRARGCCPAGCLAAGERLGASASRHLAAKVDIPEIAHLEQLETRSDPVRDPRGRVLATAYLALVTPDARPKLPG